MSVPLADAGAAPYLILAVALVLVVIICLFVLRADVRRKSER